MGLNNTMWRLREFRELDGVFPLLAGSEITANFARGGVSGSGGCNTYGGEVTAGTGNTGSFSVSNIFTTRMFCGPTISNQESRYLDFLRDANRFEIAGSSLRLLNDSDQNEKELVFDNVPVQPYGITATATSKNPVASHPIPCAEVVTKNWYAWNNKMPPKPDDFHIVGEVQVGNPGIEVTLVEKVPQGKNPKILLMDLHLRQMAGMWPQVVTWKQVRYDKILVNSDYEKVNVFCDSNMVADVDVETVH